MRVFAYYVSPISGEEVEFELVSADIPGRNAYAFQNTALYKYEQGTYHEGDNFFPCLDKFKHIYKEMSPRFVLK